jgi:hypothetical protein
MSKYFCVLVLAAAMGMAHAAGSFSTEADSRRAGQGRADTSEPASDPSSLSARSNNTDAKNECFFDERKNRLNRQRLFWESQPVTLKNCVLKRYGSPNDGGYLMCANLMSKAQSVYSYGIEGRDQWGCDVSKELNLNVHEYDCFDPKRPVCENGKLTFHDECIGDSKQTMDDKLFDTLENQIIKNKDEHKRLIVKMDVETAEWSSLWATPDDVLNNIDQLIVEFHDVNEERFVRVMRKLNRIFYIANIHFNNCKCLDKFAPFPTRSREILFVNKAIAELDQNAPKRIPPNPLTTRNCRHVQDCQIDMGDYVIDRRSNEN